MKGSFYGNNLSTPWRGGKFCVHANFVGSYLVVEHTGYVWLDYIPKKSQNA